MWFPLVFSNMHEKPTSSSLFVFLFQHLCWTKKPFSVVPFEFWCFPWESVTELWQFHSEHFHAECWCCISEEMEKGPQWYFCAPHDACGVGSPQQQTHHKELDFIGSSLKYSCRRHARNWNEEYFVPRSESAEPLYPFLPSCGAAWPCFQTTLLLNVTLL